MTDRSQDAPSVSLAPADGGDDGLAETLETELAPALKKAVQRPEQRRELMLEITRVVEEREMYGGPIPHPRHFAEFEKTLPGSADRFLVMAEDEQRHRHWWERLALKANVVSEILGQVTGFLACLAFIAAGAFLRKRKSTVAGGCHGRGRSERNYLHLSGSRAPTV